MIPIRLFWFAFALTYAMEFAALQLLVGGPLPIDSPGRTISAFVDVGDFLHRHVVADDVLPRIALLAQHGVAIVVGEATDALDGRRFLLCDNAIERR
jgi:hypothetical protein